MTDKRFWIFEASTLLYAIGLTALGCVVWDKTGTIELGLILGCLSLISGLITWPTANGWLDYIYRNIHLWGIDVD